MVNFGTVVGLYWMNNHYNYIKKTKGSGKGFESPSLASIIIPKFLTRPERLVKFVNNGRNAKALYQTIKQLCFFAPKVTGNDLEGRK